MNKEPLLRLARLEHMFTLQDDNFPLDDSIVKIMRFLDLTNVQGC